MNRILADKVDAMRSEKEQLEFFEKILNDDELYAVVLAGLTSPEELEGNKENQESALAISKMILKNIDKMHFKSEERKTFTKKYFEQVPEIVKQFSSEVGNDNL